MVEKLDSFELNLELLHFEWKKVKSLYVGQPTPRIRITYSDFDNELAPCNKPFTETAAMEELTKGIDFTTWRVENILKPFRRTYTETVVKMVNDWFAERGLRITVAKYGELEPLRTLVMHTDNYAERYHIPVYTNDAAFMIVDNRLYQMREAGSIYRMVTNVPHTAINASHENRLHLVFDVTTL